MLRFQGVEIEEQPWQTHREAEQSAVCWCLRRLGCTAGYKHNENGAPYIVSPTSIRVSISHSKRWAGVAVDSIESPRFGIDIEATDRPQLLKVLPRVVNEEELTVSRIIEDGATKAWTAKEAVFKALGETGVDFKHDIRLEGKEFEKAVYIPEKIVFKLKYAKLSENDLLCVATEYNIFEHKTL